MHKLLKPRGLEIVNVPCNQFGKQEPQSDAELQNWISKKFSSDLVMLGKTEVNGPNSCELYNWLRAKAGTKDVEWNFGKFQVYDNGNKVKNWHPKVEPNTIQPEIEEILNM